MITKTSNKYLALLFLSLLGGIFYASGFPMGHQKSFFLGPIIGFFLFNYTLYQEGLNQKSFLKKQMLLAFAFSLGFYLLGFYWIPHTLFEFGKIHYVLSFSLGLFFSLVIIPQIYLYTIISNKIKHPVLLAITYVLLEAFIPQQFPAHLGHSFLSLISFLPLKLTPYFGASIYSFFSAYLSLTILGHLKNKKAPKLSYLLLGIIIILNFTLPTPSKGQALWPLSIRVVQPNIGNFLKVDSEKGGTNSLFQIFKDYYQLSTEQSIAPLDLIVWPETAFPTPLFSNNPNQEIPHLLSSIIKKTKAELFIGGYDIKANYSSSASDFQNEYNSAFLFGTNLKLKDVYHKIKLIPFGESLPFGPLNLYLSKYITNISYFASGENYTVFKTKNDIPFISVICYEILFSSFVRDFLNSNKIAPQFIINLTNDSWYGDTAEPAQHLFLAKWRSLEFNIPIIRSTNTGITTIVMPDGSEVIRLNVNQKKAVDINLKLYQRKNTFYQSFGLWPLMILALIFYLIENPSFRSSCKRIKPKNLWPSITGKS